MARGGGTGGCRQHCSTYPAKRGKLSTGQSAAAPTAARHSSVGFSPTPFTPRALTQAAACAACPLTRKVEPGGQQVDVADEMRQLDAGGHGGASHIEGQAHILLVAGHLARLQAGMERSGRSLSSSWVRWSSACAGACCQQGPPQLPGVAGLLASSAAHQAVLAQLESVVGCVEDVGVVQLPNLF